MFIDLFYLMRARGLNVSMNEWLSLMDALEKGLCRNSLLEFYYLSRAILIKTEADFDKFDEVFLDYFDRIQHIEDIPQELMDWLQALRLGGVDPDKIENELPYAGILLKKNEDLTAVKNAKNRVRNGYRW